MFYTTEQLQMSLTGIIISVKWTMRLSTHDYLMKILSQVATEDTFNLSENVRSESASKSIIDFNVMLNRSRF
jgi:environmental stress-induced protein Ves